MIVKYFARTAFQHITKQIAAHAPDAGSGNRLPCMMPSIPIQAAFHLGGLLEDYCAERDNLAPPLIRISSELCHEWQHSEDAAIRQQFEELVAKGWPDQNGNLTAYRNAQAQEERTFLVLLVGVDRVTDAASLADLHHCDYGTVWQAELGSSFAPWIRLTLGAASIGFEDDTVVHFDQILKPLVERGLADALQVSLLLEELNLSTAQDGRDAETLLLQSLGRFNLPPFTNFQFSGRKGFGPYLEDALAFFSYDAFLEDRARQKALRTIDKLVKHNELGELFDQSERGPHSSDEEFIDALRRYVGTGNAEVRRDLIQCDFVTIRDRIIGFRAPREEPGPKKEMVSKLSGGPVEVVLAGIWKSLAEFKKAAAVVGVFPHEALREIRIESQLFKHDCDGDSPDERIRRARVYVSRLLGGVDGLIEQWLRLPRAGDSDAEIAVSSRLVHGDLRCEPARTSEPFLQFSVELFGEGLDEPVVKQFAWRLPEIEPYRVADELIQWAAQEITATDGYCLPVFHVSYYEELMLAKDDEETRRVLRHCIQDESQGMLNLLGASDLDPTDPLLPHIRKLAFEYDKFIQSARKAGLHDALQSNWDGLRKAYEQACDAYLCESDYANSPLASLLFRSFLVIQRRQAAEGDRWVWEPFQSSATITVLHPALLEMLQAHTAYLLGAFVTIASRELRASGTRAFRDVLWQNYVDLAAIQMPLCGLIRDRNKVLDTDIRGENLIHRVGSVDDTAASLTTRLLLRYDAFDEEELSDAELFRTTRESTLIFRILRDYREVHPHANDGLSIAVYQNQDIQPVIAAVDQFLCETCQHRSALPGKYGMSVTIFTESSDDTSVSRWISQWKERWEAAETQVSFAHYRQVRLSVAHRIVSPEKYYRQFCQLIDDGLQVDVAILNSFIGAGTEGNDFHLGAALFEHCLNVLYIRDLRRKIVDFAAHFWSYIGSRREC
ncbi:MAG: hypothetical protein HQ592_04100, partial [Planctomycetes bacterium]|nr:hypothetical protein [Planctomycetota bacterium]